MNVQVIVTLLSRLLAGGAVLLSLPAAMALYYGESPAPFLYTALLPLLFLFPFYRNKKRQITRLTIRESLAITALSWMLFSMLYAVPYGAGGGLGLLDSWVESVSGLTGTGATVIGDLDAMPRSLLFFRSLSHWIGGLGIIVVFIALFPPSGRNMASLVEEESTGVSTYRPIPRMKDMARALLAVYVALTVLSGLVYFLLGMTPFDAVNHAFSTIATGGFSTHNDSIGYYHNPVMNLAITFFMILGAANFGLYVASWKQGCSVFYRNKEFQLFLALLVAGTALISLNLILQGMETPGKALEDALFTATSVATTTGFVTADFDQWPAFSQGILLLLMFFGGSGGSTSGGLKIIRLLILGKALGIFLRERIHPGEIIPLRVGKELYRSHTVAGVLAFILLYISFIGLFTLLLLLEGQMSLAEALGLSLATMSNTGPALGMFGATCNWTAMTPLTKIIVSAAMLLGRLETITVLALCLPSFWTRSKW